MVTLNDSHKKLYAKLKVFFENELGFKPFRQFSYNAIIQDISEEKTQSSTPFVKCKVAIYCLISFFPPALHKNPLSEFWVINRYLKGKSPLTPYIREQLEKYSNLRNSELLEKIHSMSELALRMALGVNLFFPENEVEHYFRLYLRKFANLQEFFTEGDVTVLDAVIDDIWISRNYDVPLGPEYTLLVSTIDEIILHDLTIITKDIVWEYLQKNQASLTKGWNSSPDWLTDKNSFDLAWKKLIKKGVSNWLFMENKHFIPFHIMLSTHESLNLQEQALFSLYMGLLKTGSMCSNHIQNRVLWKFSGYYHNIDHLREFMQTLKQSTVITDYDSMTGSRIFHSTRFSVDFPEQSPMKKNSESQKSKHSNTLNLQQALVIQFYCIQTGSKLGPVHSVFRSFLTQQLHVNTHRQNTLRRFQEENFNLSQELMPSSLLKTQRFYVSEILDNISFSLIDGAVFFQLLHDSSEDGIRKSEFFELRFIISI